jgi:hypothetical protein
MTTRLLTTTATLLLACSGPARSQPAEPPRTSNEQAHPAMPNDPTHAAISLKTPYYPWQASYDRMRARPELAAILDQDVLGPLTAAGDPAGRLRAASEGMQKARLVLTRDGAQVDFSFDGLDDVEIDVKVCFFRDLAAAVAARSDLSAEARKQALQRLRALVSGPHGLPAPNERVANTQTARMTAETMIDVHLEGL